MPNFTNYGLS